MIIDIHTHTFPDKIAERAVRTLQQSSHTALFSDGTERGLLENERKAGVDLAVVQPVATYPEQTLSINRHVIERFSENPPEGLRSFAAMHPACEEWEAELERVHAAGIPGIKLHTPYAQVSMDDPRTIRILKKCRELDLIVLIHSGWDVGLPGRDEAHPRKIRNALDAAGDVKLIAAHMAGWKCWQEAADLLAETGIYLDTAVSLGRLTPFGDDYPWNPEDLQMLSDAEFCDLVHLYGADHILFGTDSPWAAPSDVLQIINASSLTPEEKADIRGNNAMRLLRLKT